MIFFVGGALYSCSTPDTKVTVISLGSPEWQEKVQMQRTALLENLEDLIYRKHVEAMSEQGADEVIRQIRVIGFHGAEFKADACFGKTSSFSPGCKPSQFVPAVVQKVLAFLIQDFNAGQSTVEVFTESNEVKHVFTRSADGAINGKRVILEPCKAREDHEDYSDDKFDSDFDFDSGN